MQLTKEQNSLLFKEQALESSINGIATADLRGNLTYVNPAFLKLWGATSKDAVLGRSALEFWRDPQDAQRVISALMEKGSWQGEMKGRRVDGNFFDALVSANLVKDENGNPLGLLASFYDVTEQRRIEEMQHRLLDIVEATSELIAVIDLSGKISYLNAGGKKLLGLVGEDLTQCNIYEFMSRAGVELLTEVLASHDAEQWTGDASFLARSLEEIPMSMTVVKHSRYDGDQSNYVSILARDVSNYQRLIFDLQTSEETFAKAQEIAHIGNWDWDIVTNELTWSDEIYRIFGLTPQQFEANYPAFLERIHPDDRESIVQAVENAVTRSIPYSIEHRVVRPNGDVRIVHERGKVYRNDQSKAIRMLGTVHDITERKQTEDALSNFKTSLDLTLDCVFMFDPGTLRFFYVNQGAIEQVEYSASELLGMTPLDIKPYFTREEFQELVRPLLEGTKKSLTFETLHRAKSGKLIPVEIFLQYINPADEKARFVAIVRDITERKQKEEEIRLLNESLEQRVYERTQELQEEIKVRESAEKEILAQKERAERYLTIAGAMIVALDTSGNITLINKRGCDLLGYDSQELIGKNWFDLTIDPLELAQVKQVFQEIVSSGSKKYALFENHVMTRTGEKRLVSWSNSILYDEEGNVSGVLSSGDDITERRHAEEALVRAKEQAELANMHLKESLETLRATQAHLVESEKMASLGGLVAGVAHEINTPVGVGVTAASYLTSRVSHFKKVYNEGKLTRSDFEKLLQVALESSEMIESNLKRAAELIRSFKQVAVDQSSEAVRKINFGQYIEEILQSLSPRLRRTNHSIRVVGPDDLELNTYAGAFSQIFTNLLLNSLQHAFEHTDQGHITIQFKKIDRHVSVVYSDDGVGVSPENLKKIFDPFFTTKRGQGGSGLGLHIIYNLVTQTLGGNIRAESEPNKGLTIYIEFDV